MQKFLHQESIIEHGEQICFDCQKMSVTTGLYITYLSVIIEYLGSYYSGGSEVDKYKICKSIVKWM